MTRTAEAEKAAHSPPARNSADAPALPVLRWGHPQLPIPPIHVERPVTSGVAF